MEIRTCEQYVVNRVMELEDENKRLKEKLKAETTRLEKENTVACSELESFIKIQADAIEDMQGVIDYLSKFISLNTSHEGENYIAMDNIWHKYDREDYFKVIEIFGLENKKEENNDED